MDIPFKFFILRHLLCFFQNGRMASCLNDPALMKRQGTEAAAAKTPTVTDQMCIRDRLKPACLILLQNRFMTSIR